MTRQSVALRQQRAAESTASIGATEPYDAAAAASEVRRAFPRYNMECPVVIKVLGSAESLLGMTINVSRGGALIRLEHVIPPGTRCLVRFVEDEAPLEVHERQCPECDYCFPRTFIPRQSVWAYARRAGEGAHGAAVAFEFQGLLDVTER